MCLVSLACRLISLVLTVLIVLIILAFLGVFEPSTVIDDFATDSKKNLTTFDNKLYKVTWNGYALIADEAGQIEDHQLKLQHAEIYRDSSQPNQLQFEGNTKIIFKMNDLESQYTDFTLILMPNSKVLASAMQKVNCKSTNKSNNIECKPGIYTNLTGFTILVIKELKITWY